MHAPARPHHTIKLATCEFIINPLVAITISHSMSLSPAIYCPHCEAKTARYACGKCRQVAFCSLGCASRDWDSAGSEHRLACRASGRRKRWERNCTKSARAQPISDSITRGRADAIPVRVTKIVDGDTVHVQTARELDSCPTTYRLLGMDAPELAQEYGRESMAALAALLATAPGGDVIWALELGDDKYGRTLAHLYLNRKDVPLSGVRQGEDGAGDQSIGARMVDLGVAWNYRPLGERVMPNGEFVYTPREDRARKSMLGLWGVGRAPVPPGVFRAQKKMGRVSV